MKYFFLQEQNIDDCNEKIYDHCNAHDLFGGPVYNDQADDPEVKGKFERGKKII